MPGAAKRAVGGGITAGDGMVNGLARAERTEYQFSVVADGDRTRYPGGAYECMRKEWARCANLGGTAGSKSCPNGDKAFFVYRKGDPFMKLYTKRWRRWRG